MKTIHVRVPSGLKEEMEALIPSHYNSFAEMTRASLKVMIFLETKSMERLGINIISDSLNHNRKGKGGSNNNARRPE